MLTISEARRLALSFAEVTEDDHHGIPSFRVRGKIFATVPDGDHVRLMFEPDVARTIVRADPDACEELWWGKKRSGCRVVLKAATTALVRELLAESWRRRAPAKLRARLDA